MEQKQKFDNLLQDTWKNVFEKNPQLFHSGFENKVRKLENGMYLYYNVSRNNSKYANENTSKPNSLSSKLSTETETVYLEFDEGDFNFNKVKMDEILFYLNLDELQAMLKSDIDNMSNSNKVIVDKQQENQTKSANQEEIEQQFRDLTNHPVVISAHPICKNHCIIPLFCKELLPQVLSSDIFLYLLNIFQLSSKDTFRIGYNSIGAFASTNHLHFQGFYVDDLLKDCKKMPIELAQRKEIFTKHSECEELKNIEFRVEKLIDYPLKCFVVTSFMKDEKQQQNLDIGMIYGVLTEATGIITNLLLDLQIPYNILISDQGRCIYIIPRTYQKYLDSSVFPGPALFEVSGVVVVKKEEDYNALTANEIMEFYNLQLSLQDQEFDYLVKQMESRLSNQ